MSYNSAIEFYLQEIANNCKIKRKKDVAIKHLSKVYETLKVEDKLRIQLWDIIKTLEKVEPRIRTDFDD
jgi:hypothetical protein